MPRRRLRVDHRAIDGVPARVVTLMFERATDVVKPWASRMVHSRRRLALASNSRVTFDVPRGTIHNFRNTAETPSRILVGFTPSGIEGFFRESGRPATDDGPAPPLNEDEIARTTTAASKYGLEAVAFD